MRTLAFLFMIIIFYSCSTLNPQEISNLKKTTFNPLQLRPGIETNDLRIDLIRQTETYNDTDSTTATRNVDYHPLGFDLGNGLFFDVNDNLCLRIDYLISASPDNFNIKKTYRPEHNKKHTHYIFSNDSLLIKSEGSKNNRYIFHRSIQSDTMTFFHKNRFLYQIIASDTSLLYGGKKRIIDGIYLSDVNEYYVNNRKHNRIFSLSEKEIHLMDWYKISMPDADTILIKRAGRKNDYLLYTIIQSDDLIFLFNKDFQGIKIVFEDQNKILLFRNADLITKYELVN